MTIWEYRQVPFKFQLSDWTLFSVKLPMQVRAVTLMDKTPPMESLVPPTDPLTANSQGFFIHALHVSTVQPHVSTSGGYICYTQLQYRHCFIDFGMSFEDYLKKFSSKTRSTINRKVKKYAEHCGGSIPWKVYKTPGEMREFFRFAREVSSKTYQEKILDAGIPDSEDFVRKMESLAGENRIRAYVLFDGPNPVSYIYCPVKNGVLNYAYLGYDPKYMRMSVGTVLQWLAVEQLFKESCFQFFDFTEGQSEHKRLFATDEIHCANVIFLKRSLRNKVLIYSHLFMERLSKKLGDSLAKLGVKARIKRFFRFIR